MQDTRIAQTAEPLANIGLAGRNPGFLTTDSPSEMHSVAMEHATLTEFTRQRTEP
jgi:hypothetical protein